MAKKVSIKPKVKTAAPPRAVADAWVEGNSQKMKRLTIDVSEDLHRRIKVGCASRGAKMADEIRGLLEREFRGGGA